VLKGWKGLLGLEVISLGYSQKVSGQLQECRAEEFQILGDATEKLRVPNDV